MARLGDIAAYLAASCRVDYGDASAETEVDGPASLSRAAQGTVAYMKAATPTAMSALARCKASVLIVPEGIEAPSLPDTQLVAYSRNPRLDFARVVEHFFAARPAPGISPSATVSPEARLGEDVVVASGCVIGAATVGARSVIDSGAVIHDGVVIGTDCHVFSGAVVGSLGFGFERDEEGRPVRLPHLGGVTIGDNCEIGAGTCVDRGTIDDTVIEGSVMIDNLVHIAHNTHIGTGTMIAASAVVAGSTRLGKGVWVGPGAVISDGLVVGDGASVTLGAVVTQDVEPDARVTGNFAVEHRMFLRHLKSMRSETP